MPRFNSIKKAKECAAAILEQYYTNMDYADFDIPEKWEQKILNQIEKIIDRLREQSKNKP